MFDSSNVVSWDSVSDPRKFNRTSKNSVPLTQGGYVKGTLALQSCLTVFLLLFLCFLLILLNIITFSFEKLLMLRSKMQL